MVVVLLWQLCLGMPTVKPRSHTRHCLSFCVPYSSESVFERVERWAQLFVSGNDDVCWVSDGGFLGAASVRKEPICREQ